MRNCGLEVTSRVETEDLRVLESGNAGGKVRETARK